jgi:hypothetical protein
MKPRYQCHRSGTGWSWRLLGSNNRPLARGTRPAASQADAARDALEVAALAATAQIDVVTDSGPSWRWSLVSGGSVCAESVVPYARRLECVRAVARFRECAGQAPVLAAPSVYPAMPPPAPEGRPRTGREWVG